MQFTLASLVLAAAGAVSAQGVASGIAPASPPPAGCTENYASKFEITVVLPTYSKRDVLERRAACAGAGTLVVSMSKGVLTDAVGRIGSIVANGQFQFDGPPAQTGAIYTGGWSVCGNGSLALGGSAVFYQCSSTSFYNLYDRSIGPQCSPVEIDVIPCGSSSGATQIGDGQVQASSAVTQITDGQIQVTSAGPKVTQITDGQIQVTSAGPKVTQISDGQIQVTSAVPRPPVSQYTDGQLQVTAMPTARPVSQITDGQIQAPTTAPVVSQITDGQIQVPTTIITKPVVSQITDGQIQAPNATASATKPVVTGAAARMTMGASICGAVVAIGVFAML